MAFPRKQFVTFLIAGFLAGSALTATVLGVVVLERQTEIAENQAALAAQRQSEESTLSVGSQAHCDRGAMSVESSVIRVVRINVTQNSAQALAWKTPVEVIDRDGFELQEANQTLELTADRAMGYAAFVITWNTSQPQLLMVPCTSLQATWAGNATPPGFLLLSAQPYTLRIEHMDPGCIKREVGPGGAMERDLVSTGVFAGQMMAVTYQSPSPGCPSATFFYEYEGVWNVSDPERSRDG